MAKLLLIEDEQVIRLALTRMLTRNGFSVAEAASVAAAEQRYGLSDFDLIISDLRLPGEPGTAIIKRTRVPVLIMTSYASIKSAVEAMQQGAADYIAKPFQHEELIQAIRRVLARQPAPDKKQPAPTDTAAAEASADMIGNCAAMRLALDLVHKVAPTDTTVLVLGESGTGKELIARALHRHSRRAAAPLVAVNCAAIPENLIESELFGHERGAFTGAVSAREGLIEAADGGTLFLDEIGELPLNAQARLLRVLQEGELRRLGTARSRRVDVRLIAATHRDLPQRVSEGLLRSDLYYRLRVVEIRLPPLRERGDDMVRLAEAMLAKACRRLNRRSLTLPAETLAAIRAYAWPGNVRELENAIERAAVLAEGSVVGPELLALGPESVTVSESGPPRSDVLGVADDLSLDDYLRRFVLARQGELTETEIARQLGISRKSLWERRQRLNIPRPRGRRS